jgi:hypothetical protein
MSKNFQECNMKIIAIDPGNKDSAYAVWDGKVIEAFGKLDNAELKNDVVFLRNRYAEDQHTIVIEMIASYGMPVGKEVFETCLYIGQLQQVNFSRTIQNHYTMNSSNKQQGQPESQLSAADMTELAQTYKRVAMKKEALIQQMTKVLLGYEDWEAELIGDNRCWGPEGMASLPRLTNELYDKMLALQAMRNDVLRPLKTAPSSSNESDREDRLGTANDIEKWITAEAEKYAEKTAFRVPYDGTDNFYDEQVYQSSRAHFKKGATSMHTRLQTAEDRIKELEQWKREAISVMPDYQAIGKALNIPLGQSVHDKILPGIERMKERTTGLERLIRQMFLRNCKGSDVIFNSEWPHFCQLHNIDPNVKVSDTTADDQGENAGSQNPDSPNVKPQEDWKVTLRKKFFGVLTDVELSLLVDFIQSILMQKNHPLTQAAKDDFKKWYVSEAYEVKGDVLFPAECILDYIETHILPQRYSRERVKEIFATALVSNSENRSDVSEYYLNYFDRWADTEEGKRLLGE